MPEVTFQYLVLLFPVATLAHILEEWPGFPRWARQFASPRYSNREYRTVHRVALALAVCSAVLASVHPQPWLLFLFFAFILGPAVFWNAFFHLAASVATRRICPGAITGALFYVPLATGLAALAARESLLSPGWLSVAFLLALPLHVLEVGHSVFKRW